MVWGAQGAGPSRIQLPSHSDQLCEGDMPPRQFGRMSVAGGPQTPLSFASVVEQIADRWIRPVLEGGGDDAQRGHELLGEIVAVDRAAAEDRLRRLQHG